MTDILLYSGAVLIWGTTWLAIKMQLGVVAPELSIVYRFSAAAFLMFGFCRLTGRSLRFRGRDHLMIAAQGMFLFSLGYLCNYYAAQYITSGLMSVLFSAVVIANIINSAIFLGRRITLDVVTGALLGLAGISLVFWHEVMSVGVKGESVRGLCWVLAATIFASFGNILAAKNQKRGIPVLQSNAYGMLYGAILTLLVAWARSTPIAFDASIRYVASLAYLAIFGSAVAFWLYLTLLGRIGAERASYAAVLFPIVALALSTHYEHFHWTTATFMGIALILAGNVFTLYRAAGKRVRTT